MGELTISVGPLTSTKTFDNVKGATIIKGYIDRLTTGPDGSTDMTDQEKLDWLVNQLAAIVLNEYHNGKRQAALASVTRDIWE